MKIIGTIMIMCGIIECFAALRIYKDPRRMIVTNVVGVILAISGAVVYSLAQYYGL